MSMKDPAAMLRVDQAGEYGAMRIYAGQLAVMGTRGPDSAKIAAMAGQEAGHLDKLNAMMAARRVRPTALQPLWHVAGYALGAASALIGPKAAMACTAAIEQEIDRHYSAQLDDLGDTDAEFGTVIEAFRDDERAHRQTALDAGAEQAPFYPLFSGAVRLGCRLAIRLSEKI